MTTPSDPGGPGTNRASRNGHDAGADEHALARLAGTDAPDVLAVIDESATVVWLNRRGADLLGRTPAEVVGTRIEDLLHPDDLDLALTVLASAAIERPDLRPARYRLRHADGSFLEVEANGVPTTLPDGRGGLVVSARAFGGHVVDVLASLAEGKGLPAVIDDILDAFLWHREGTAAVISWTDEDGARVASLGSVPAGIAGNPGPPGPGLTTSAPVRLTDPTRLHPVLREAAAEGGFAGCVTTHVEDPADPGGGAWITQWARDPQILELLELGAIREPAWALQLALRQRHDRRRLEDAARQDPLTGLANRTRLFEVLARHERAGQTVTALYCDLDGLKPVNDDHGHDVGDAVLVATAERLLDAVRAEDLVARVGGDEFVVVCPGTGDGEAATLAERLLAVVARPVRVDGGEVAVTVSVGVAAGPAWAPDALIAAADAAMYEAKRAGRSAWRAAPQD